MSNRSRQGETNVTGCGCLILLIFLALAGFAVTLGVRLGMGLFA